MKKRVLVAMSGGVDSSLASYLLKESGFEVAGLTMCFGIKEVNRKKPACCGSRAINDAKRVCSKLRIPHYVMDFSRYLNEEVIDKFISEYLNGRTPNPCVDCNRSLKFDILLKKALSLDFNFLATGHYAIIEKKRRSYILKRAKDKTKDQSYFLYSIKKNALKSILFPLGKLTKSEVRDIARKIKLPVANKPQSQDLCFIPEGNHHRFLRERAERVRKMTRGSILDLNGNVLGKHKGAVFYTVGQRGGLGVAYKRPLYVLSVNAKKNELVVGERKDLTFRGLVAGEVNLLVKSLPKKVFAKIRYNQKEAKCTVSHCDTDGKFEVIFEKPEEAVTPGQSVVFYDRDIVLGGGVIEGVIRLTGQPANQSGGVMC